MNSDPEFVYRLATQEEWGIARDRGTVPLRDIDRADGYVHLSTRSQVLETANVHFAGVDGLMALEIALAPLAAQIKFELAPKRGEAFPHLYGTLRVGDVVRAIPLDETDNGFVFGDTQ